MQIILQTKIYPFRTGTRTGNMFEKITQLDPPPPDKQEWVHSMADVVSWHLWREPVGRFLSAGIILGFPLSYTDLFLYTITLPAVSCDAPPTLSYTTLELASRVLLSSKKPALCSLGSVRIS